ncbi:hypothetical protein [Paenibacillus aestuarii]|uniref:Uncharacterized protein n=1 Tax=Paenibacillus aestuarii TaxID=516965 RepID=A0ABW0KFZ3_9BACL|nr:hypothetical protein [Paenibacillus aestuarii]
MNNNQLQELIKEFRRMPITSLQDVGKAIFQNALTCFIQETENKIRSVSTDELQMKWVEIKNHILPWTTRHISTISPTVTSISLTYGEMTLII